MKKLSLLVSLVLVFALSVWAQTPSPNDSQSGSTPSATQSQTSPSSTSPSSTSPSSQGTTGSQDTTSPQTMGSQGSSSNTGQGNMGTSEQGKMGKDHKLKGCLEAEGGTYELREKGGKEVVLTGSSDLSQYANHEVVVHGTWANGGAAPASTTSDMSKGSEKQFTVSKVESVSDTCKGGKHAGKDKDKGNNPSSQQ